MAEARITSRVEVLESEDQFGVRSFTPFDDDTPLESGSDAQRIAGLIARIRAVPDIQVRDLTVNLTGADAETVATIYGVDFNDLIRVSVNLPGGLFELDRNIQGVRHRFRLGSATTTFRTGTPLLTRFILGSSEFGRLGQNTL